jgi:hypothetical protein
MQRRALRAVRTSITWCVIFLMTANTGQLLGCGSCGGGSCGSSYGGNWYGGNCYGDNWSGGNWYGSCSGTSCCATTVVYNRCSATGYNRCSATATYSDCGSRSNCNSGSPCVVEGGYSEGYIVEGQAGAGYREETSVGAGCTNCAADSYVTDTGAEVLSEGVEAPVVDDNIITDGSSTRVEMPTDSPADLAIPQFAAPDPEDDLFSEPPAEAPVTERDSEPPVSSSTDDLFGEPLADAIPLELTPDATAPDAGDDLFGDPPAATPVEPAPDAATPNAGDDMFEESADIAPADAMPVDTPAVDPAVDSGEDDLDDLFGEPATDDPTAPAAEETPAEETDEENLDDLFGSMHTRRWMDDTGQHSTEGHLVMIRRDSIRILKSNGRHCTVPYDRLSDVDYDYVQAIAARLGTPIVQLASID